MPSTPAVIGVRESLPIADVMASFGMNGLVHQGEPRAKSAAPPALPPGVARRSSAPKASLSPLSDPLDRSSSP